jgi:hypothetical protein
VAITHPGGLGGTGGGFSVVVGKTVDVLLTCSVVPTVVVFELSMDVVVEVDNDWVVVLLVPSGVSMVVEIELSVWVVVDDDLTADVLVVLAVAVTVTGTCSVRTNPIFSA